MRSVGIGPVWYKYLCVHPVHVVMHTFEDSRCRFNVSRLSTVSSTVDELVQSMLRVGCWLFPLHCLMPPALGHDRGLRVCMLILFCIARACVYAYGAAPPRKVFTLQELRYLTTLCLPCALLMRHESCKCVERPVPAGEHSSRDLVSDGTTHIHSLTMKNRENTL